MFRVGVVSRWRTLSEDWQTASKNSIKWRRFASYCSTKCDVRKAANPPSEFYLWRFVFLCSSEPIPLCRVSNHTAREIQCILMHGNPPDNTIKTLHFCHELTVPTVHQEALILHNATFSERLAYLGNHNSHMPSCLKLATKSMSTTPNLTISLCWFWLEQSQFSSR